ncbi:MAG: AAA family ATPase [Chloroflexota bacterium]|nr:AAA family ATPase [Chloroflexota bacterium]
MTQTKTTAPEIEDRQATMQALREYADELDPFIPYEVLYDHLKSKNDAQYEPLEPSALWKIARERPSKRGLIRAEYIEDYIRGRLRSMREAGYDPKDIRRTLKFNVSENCEVKVSDERIDELMTEGEEPDEVGVLMADVVSEKVEWLWEGRIPLGKLTVLDGDPGLGKSVITMDLAARVTNGQPFPDGDLDGVGALGGDGGLGGVVILSAEDGLADTIRPRLDAAGADPSRVVAISTVPDREGNERTMSIPQDISTIEKAIQRVRAKLVIVDPLMAFLSGKANYDQDVRKALTPLVRMAESTGVAVVVVRHLNKQQGGKAIYRGGSSIGIIGAARSGLVVEAHPDNKDLRVLAMNKSNLAEKAASLTYSITTAENDAAKVLWGATSELNADDLLNPKQEDGEESRAVAWLNDTLEEGPVLQEVIKATAEGAGISWRTLERAKSSLGVKSKKDGKKWAWYRQDRQHRQQCQDRQLVAVN